MDGNRRPPSLTEDELWARYGQDESGTLEFKERLPRHSRLQEPLVAFANARGGAVVVGVAEGRPRRVTGTGWTQQDAERVQEAARIAQPPLVVAPQPLLVVGPPDEGRLVVVLRVEPVERGWVHTSDGRLLVRAGPTNRALIGEELARFVRERSADPVEDEPVRGVTLADLRPDALRGYLRDRLGKQRIAVEADARRLGLLTPTGQVRLAALLLFGEEPQRDNRRFGITVSRYEGGVGDGAGGAASGPPGGAVLRERTELRGTLPELVRQADRLLYEEMRKSAVVQGLVREEVPEYPPAALREALVNAVGHRDYSLRGATIDVRLYDDAVEVESPGALAGYVTVENIRAVQYSRNERLMEALQRLRLAEEAGTGIDRMFTAMEDALLEAPHLEERSSSFLVRLYGRSVFAAEDRLWVARFADLGLSADARVALVYARRHAAITNGDLRALRALDERASRQVLQNLVTRGLLEPVGRARGTRYVLSSGALHTGGQATGPDDRLAAVLAHARREGSVANRDVRGLLGVDRREALELLDELVARGALIAVGNRRARRYHPPEVTPG